MSLLSNNKKKGGKTGIAQPKAAGHVAPKGKANTKSVSRNTRLTGGSQRGS
ncbi:hypothetical protein [Chitinophaga defluvii]|uniref:Uncharacterized protein n=1 Tax=Chitinophaga defluvii TaxID=3163343 RepID=A0ABV2T3Z7_9BACT